MAKASKTDRFLVIVESPTKAKKITKYLDDAGYKAIVMASKGHIMKLADKRGSYKNTGIYPDKDFSLNLQIDEEHEQVVDNLKEQVKRVNKIYLASDDDREGYVIAWSLAKFLKLKEGSFCRAIMHEITPKAVIHAIENPVDMDLNLVDAGMARMMLDKMIGYGLTPEAKLYLGVRSVGRCQSIGLKLVVDREKEILNFIPEHYFDLFLNFVKNGLTFKAKYDGNRLKSKQEVDTILATCSKDFMIESIDKHEKSESPKPPFTTATFQQEASSKLGLGVKDSMTIAQKLFEDGKITYHRSDSTEMAPEFALELKNYLKNDFVEPRKGKKDAQAQNGHECLRITDINLTPDLYETSTTNALMTKVYKLIWQRTVASAMPNAIFSETKYIIDNNGVKFNLISNELMYEGFKQVYATKADDQAIKETFELSEKLDQCQLEHVAKETQPPARYTEASLVKELQANGCGRPSTYATIVETVLSKSRGYAELEDKKIKPTERGIQLADFLDRAFSNIININYTVEMEKELDNIACGKTSKLDFITNFYTTLEETIKNNKEKNAVPQTNTKVCPKCGGTMVMRRSRYGKLFYGCSSYPNCNGIISAD